MQRLLGDIRAALETVSRRYANTPNERLFGFLDITEPLRDPEGKTHHLSLGAGSAEGQSGIAWCGLTLVLGGGNLHGYTLIFEFGREDSVCCVLNTRFEEVTRIEATVTLPVKETKEPFLCQRFTGMYPQIAITESGN